MSAVAMFQVTHHGNYWCVRVKYRHDYYIFRYVYKTREEASKTRLTLEETFGKPVSPELDLECNYWCLSDGALATFSPVKKAAVGHVAYYLVKNYHTSATDALPIGNH